VVVIDDTFNSNPVGARRAIERLSALGSGRRVVVSPGMMELGDVQFRENLEFARFAAQRGVDVIVVGHTNRDALLAGAREAGRPALWVPSREAARTMLATDLRSGDAVLWENDLPDHYP
jgi:UDP-N-acetylmuramoyl-tripeptide--D-alanyl-D-alanine ligase